VPAPTIRDFELEKTDPAGPIPLNSNSWARFWIVPKKYVERVGGEGYKKAPVAAGPYRFVSITPGLELTLEAFGQYWRKTPSVKRLVFRAIPDEATRLVALKRGEVDIIYGIRGELAEELARTKGLILQPIISKGTHWLYFADQWDPRSPWHDQRVRRAAGLAIDRKTINQAQMLGHSKLTGRASPRFTQGLRNCTPRLKRGKNYEFKYIDHPRYRRLRQISHFHIFTPRKRWAPLSFGHRTCAKCKGVSALLLLCPAILPQT
jgi:ABC-type transport system substrate-binding protein